MMRKTTARTAVDTLCAGSSDSAAAIVTSSMPPKAKATASRPAAKPGAPLGRKFSVKLDRWTVSVFGHQPSAMSRPMTMNTMMTPTLMMENQNSNSPKPRTAAKLMMAKKVTAMSAGTHGAQPVHPAMMAEAPVISEPMTMMSMNQ